MINIILKSLRCGNKYYTLPLTHSCLSDPDSYRALITLRYLSHVVFHSCQPTATSNNVRRWRYTPHKSKPQPAGHAQMSTRKWIPFPFPQKPQFPLWTHNMSRAMLQLSLVLMMQFFQPTFDCAPVAKCSSPIRSRDTWWSGFRALITCECFQDFFSFPYNYDCWSQLKVSLIIMHALIRRRPKKTKTWPSTISQTGSLFSPALHSQRIWNKQPLYSSTWSTFRHPAIMCLRLLLANRPGRRFFLIIFFFSRPSHTTCICSLFRHGWQVRGTKNERYVVNLLRCLYYCRYAAWYISEDAISVLRCSSQWGLTVCGKRLPWGRGFQGKLIFWIIYADWALRTGCNFFPWKYIKLGISV